MTPSTLDTRQAYFPLILLSSINSNSSSHLLPNSYDFIRHCSTIISFYCIFLFSKALSIYNYADLSVYLCIYLWALCLLPVTCPFLTNAASRRPISILSEFPYLEVSSWTGSGTVPTALYPSPGDPFPPKPTSIHHILFIPLLSTSSNSYIYFGQLLIGQNCLIFPDVLVQLFVLVFSGLVDLLGDELFGLYHVLLFLYAKQIITS